MCNSIKTGHFQNMYEYDILIPKRSFPNETKMGADLMEGVTRDVCCHGTIVYPCLSNGSAELAGNGLCYSCRNFWVARDKVNQSLIRRGQAGTPLTEEELEIGERINTRPGFTLRDVRGTYRNARFDPEVSWCHFVARPIFF